MMIIIIIIIVIIIIIIIMMMMMMEVMSRSAQGAPAFAEHRHSKFPDLCTIINLYRYQ